MAKIENLLSNIFTNTRITTPSVINRNNSNPFEQASTGNPFVTSNPYANYGQNKPVAGGYFAGYYNNQPNIVGRRLFIEV